MKRQKSPCTNVCDFSHYKGWCAGCGCTRQELKDWKHMEPDNINELQEKLQKRMDQMAKFRTENKWKG
ncbi:DUF1289 domain-containing protein [Marinomonas sp. C2222]|uniref:DUF1289 domain-containing protein n=1 Tax=Marinomonas sargassi TaxID=2984494 RepID=A0ABT2YUL9_9GAMM|nr:DUF1289 domain-containing protein [Marinomonas sargassi]MCV2403585.1 DUF1289 domain-containing protein [Marinomonas sargassi]